MTDKVAGHDGSGLSERLGRRWKMGNSTVSHAPCTQWFRHDHINGWEFNHLEDGHAVGEKPVPHFPSQLGWRNATWERYHCWLTADVPPKVTFVGPHDQ